jgi:hypothetical protein
MVICLLASKHPFHLLLDPLAGQYSVIHGIVSSFLGLQARVFFLGR